MLEDYVDVPRATSLLNMRYIPTPTKRSAHSGVDLQSDDGDHLDEEEEEEYQYMLAELYKRPTRYELDLSQYERPRQQLLEYVSYRGKFEQSQGLALNELKNAASADAKQGEGGVPSLNLQPLDPKSIQ
jgi:murein DD-endopeptidase MepM/ murein hydrolase activator NlpD